jgi:hypothetical protein
MTAESKKRRSINAADIDEILRKLCSDFVREGVYYCPRLPPISLLDYLHRFDRYLYRDGDDVYKVVTIMYILRLGIDGVNKYTVFRMFLACALLAYKFCYDIPETNTYFATLGGVSVREMNRLETETLQRLDYDLNVSESEYWFIYELIKPSSTEFSTVSVESSCKFLCEKKFLRMASLVK